MRIKHQLQWFYSDAARAESPAQCRGSQVSYQRWEVSAKGPVLGRF